MREKKGDFFFYVLYVMSFFLEKIQREEGQGKRWGYEFFCLVLRKLYMRYEKKEVYMIQRGIL